MPLVDIAADYVAAGMAVHPLKARAKEPATQHGCKDASKDLDQVRRWFTNTDANIGVRMGAESGTFVLDVDGAKGGFESLAALEAEHGKLPKTVTVITGSGGRHYTFKYPGGHVGNRVGVRPGLDVRGDNGYVVGVGSIHPNGNKYEWLPDHGLGEVEIAEAPPWLLEAIASPAKEAAAAQPELKFTLDDPLLGIRAEKYVASIPAASEGTRNAEAFKAAGNLAALRSADGSGLTDACIFGFLLPWNARCSPPLPEQELVQCVLNARKNGTPPAPKPPRNGPPIPTPGAIQTPPFLKGAPTPTAAPEDAMSENVQALLRTERRVQNLFVGVGKPAKDEAGKPLDQSPRGYDLSFIMALARTGVRDPNELGTALLHRPDGHARKAGKAYVEETVTRALKFFEEKKKARGPVECPIIVDRVRIFMSNPPSYEFTIGGIATLVSSAQLAKPGAFSQVVLQAHHRLVALPRGQDWAELVNAWLAAAERVEMPPEASNEPRLREAILAAVADLVVGSAILDLDHGKGVKLDDGRVAFKAKTIRKLVEEEFPDIRHHELCRVLKDSGFESATHRVGDEAARAWTPRYAREEKSGGDV